MSNSEEATLYAALTEREKEILEQLAAGHSDQEIGASLFLSGNTVRWYNRQIYSKLGVASRTQAVARAKQMGLLDGAIITPAPPVRGALLPRPATPLIGRRRELAEAKELLQSTRLLTLIGVGGTGKTRLALHVAEGVSATFADGVCFVDLAPVKDATMVADSIATALNVSDPPHESLQATLIHILADREMLLLLDNFEHVITAAPLLSDLLKASTRLKFMVTSREPLRLAGEQEYAVPPLALPAGETPSFEEIAASEAGTLFLQRAKMVNPRFTLTRENAPIIAQICRRLDGLPLAIELAAVRCKMLPPKALLARLEKPLHALTGGVRDAPDRQQTLRNTIAWSFNLLDDAEKRLFARMALFSGGGSLEAVEVICGDAPNTDVLEVLASLVDKSLVRQRETQGGDPRFGLLETLREYALEQFEAHTDYETMRQRYAEYYVELAERAEPEMRLARQKQWFQLLATEQENLRAVLQWSLREGAVAVTQGIRIAGALSWYWYAHGHHVEGLQWTQRLLPLLDRAPHAYHAKFLIGAAHMMRVRNFDTTIPLLQNALTVARKQGDTHHTAYALIRLGYELMETPDALPMVEEGLALFDTVHYLPGVAHAWAILGEIHRSCGNDDLARHAYENSLAWCRHLGDRRGTLTMLLNLTFVARHQDDYPRALTLAQEALQLAHELELQVEMAECLAALAGIIGVTGNPRLAARLFGTVEITLEHLGAFYDAPDRQEFEGMVAAVRTQLDTTSFEKARMEGRQMPLKAAVESALRES